MLLLGALVGGCGSDGDDPLPVPPAPSRHGSVGFRTPGPLKTLRLTPPEVASDDSVKYHYLFFWRSFMDAQYLRDPNFPKLAQRGEGEALAFARTSIEEYKKNGWVRVMKDGFQTHSKVLERTDGTARVSDVQDWSEWPLTVRASGQVVEGSAPRQCITADLVRRDDIWVVARLVFVQNAC
ncbi:xylanase [Frankia sp. Mgl5]|uniref:xylanase n=1 Tax=Frankia sp. Mgl5 TaxID=2933793 RepID=UPI0020107093|nr:xylanase [Frankia sp. Mgl5]MCK9932774.1 xylanase [Frankia sp. Mgl5]